MTSENDSNHDTCAIDWDNVSIDAVVELEMMKESLEHFLVPNLEKFGRLLNLESRHNGKDNSSLLKEVDNLVSVISDEIEEYENDDDDEPYICPLMSDANELYDYWDISTDRLVWTPPSAHTSAQQGNTHSIEREAVGNNVPHKVTLQRPTLGMIPEEEEDEDDMDDEDTDSRSGNDKDKIDSSALLPVKRFPELDSSSSDDGDVLSPSVCREHDESALLEACIGNNLSTEGSVEHEQPTVEKTVTSEPLRCPASAVTSEEDKGEMDCEKTENNYSTKDEAESEPPPTIIQTLAKTIASAIVACALQTLSNKTSQVSEGCSLSLETCTCESTKDEARSESSALVDNTSPPTLVKTLAESFTSVTLADDVLQTITSKTSPIGEGFEGSGSLETCAGDSFSSGSSITLYEQNAVGERGQSPHHSVTGEVIPGEDKVADEDTESRAAKANDDSSSPMATASITEQLAEKLASAVLAGALQQISTSPTAKVETTPSKNDETEMLTEQAKHEAEAKAVTHVTQFANASQSSKTLAPEGSQKQPTSKIRMNIGSNNCTQNTTEIHEEDIASEIERLIGEVVDLRGGNRTAQLAFPATNGGDRCLKKIVHKSTDMPRQSTDLSMNKTTGSSSPHDGAKSTAQNQGLVYMKNPERTKIRFQDLLQPCNDNDTDSTSAVQGSFPSRGSGLCRARPQCKADKRGHVNIHSMVDSTYKPPCNCLNSKHLVTSCKTSSGKTADGDRSDTKEQVIWVRLSDVSLIAENSVSTHTPVKQVCARTTAADSKKHSGGKVRRPMHSKQQDMTEMKANKQMVGARADSQAGKTVPLPEQYPKRSAVIKRPSASSKMSPLTSKDKLKAKSSIGGAVLPSKLKNFGKPEPLRGAAKPGRSSKEKTQTSCDLHCKPKEKTVLENITEKPAKSLASDASQRAGFSTVVANPKVSGSHTQKVHVESQTKSNSQPSTARLAKISSATSSASATSGKTSHSVSMRSEGKMKRKADPAPASSKSNKEENMLKKKLSSQMDDEQLASRRTQPEPWSPEDSPVTVCDDSTPTNRHERDTKLLQTKMQSLPKIPLTADGEGYDATAWIKAYHAQKKEAFGQSQQEECASPLAKEHNRPHKRVTQSDAVCGQNQLVEQPDLLSLPILPFTRATEDSYLSVPYAPKPTTANEAVHQNSMSTHVGPSATPDITNDHQKGYHSVNQHPAPHKPQLLQKRRKGHGREQVDSLVPTNDRVQETPKSGPNQLPLLVPCTLPILPHTTDGNYDQLRKTAAVRDNERKLGSEFTSFTRPTKHHSPEMKQPKGTECVNNNEQDTATMQELSHGLDVPKKSKSESMADELPPLTKAPGMFCSLPKLQRTSDGKGYDAGAWIRANRDRVQHITAASKKETSPPLTEALCMDKSPIEEARASLQKKASRLVMHGESKDNFGSCAQLNNTFVDFIGGPEGHAICTQTDTKLSQVMPQATTVKSAGGMTSLTRPKSCPAKKTSTVNQLQIRETQSCITGHRLPQIKTTQCKSLPVLPDTY